MTERPDGFYWVRRREPDDWEVGRCSCFGTWHLTGIGHGLLPREIHEIGERVERGAVASEREACAKIAEEMVAAMTSACHEESLMAVPAEYTLYDVARYHALREIMQKIRERK